MAGAVKSSEQAVIRRTNLNDVDCVLLISAGFPRDAEAEAELLAGLPFISMEFVDADAFREFTERIFDTDRDLALIGMIEVMP